jgi:hypothetical protein
MSETDEINTNLIGKPVDELTPAELASLSSQLAGLKSEIDARQTVVKETAEKEAFTAIAEAAKEQTQIVLGWAKLPKLILEPDADGNNYIVAYATTKKSGSGKRTKSDISNGDITINKIGIAMGGIAWFKDKNGTDHEGIKDLVKVLVNPATGESEENRCWDISRKGISASDIVTKYHGDEVTLVFNDSTELLVKDAVEKLKAARESAA